MVYGKSDLKPEESDWLNRAEIRTSFCENLHAKCYISESTAIITSMNLYDFSQQHNNEMGILVRRDEDAGLFDEIWQEAQRLVVASKLVRLSVEEIQETPKRETGRSSGSSGRAEPNSSSSIGRGFCISCGDDGHPFNPDKPLCYSCYKTTGRGANLAEAQDRVCHSCGSPNSSTIEKPVCYSCYKAMR